ncbi:autotransporter family protein [Pseudomonas sp. S9]|uniref:autotransporter family protein n=1 Tax=Pseudomonas sp. S9 TaxID=686578 RepID=UPI0002556C72|nr:autotransporter outer membrane beta-barrel domain-containing protein [Pseudomonas sp. S9]
MHLRPTHLARCIALSLFAGVTTQALAVDLTISDAVSDSQELGGESSLTISDSGSVITKKDPAVLLKGDTSGSGVTIENSGILQSSKDRGIDSDDGDGPARNYQIINRAGATIDAAKQGIRIDGDFAGSRVRIDNAGTITSQDDRAIMLKALQTDVKIDILNRETGIIHGVVEDGMRLGANATVINYGEISSGDMTDDEAKFDGIDFDESSGGKVENHGLISGGRHGITTDLGAELINYQDGVIIGRNGSGFGSDGDGKGTNYGRITGSYNGIAPNGDGDGVDIDGQGYIDNHGIIEGTGAGGEKDGAANTGEGIAMGGGTIINREGATISGAANAILIDDSATGGAPFATFLENHGSILGLDGDGVRIIGDQADNVINNGLISGASGLALDLGGGDDNLTLGTHSQFVGLVDGGEGRDSLTLDDTAGGSFGNSQNFEWLAVKQGTWTITSDDFNEGGEVQSSAGLINQGHIGGTLNVKPGATYSGAGQLQNLNLEAGSTLAFAVAADGSHTPVQVNGSAQVNGAKLDVRAGSGDYPKQSSYSVINATEGVTGEFASVSSNFAFLTPTLSYTANSVELELQRNDVAFSDLASGANAANAAQRITASSNPVLYNALLSSDASSASAGLEQLAGASNASLANATLAGSSQIGSAMLGAMQQLGGGMSGNLQSAINLQDGPLLAANGLPNEARNLNDPNAQGRLWVQALGSNGTLDGNNGSHDIDQNTGGAVIGTDWALNGQWRLGVLAGYSNTDIDAGSDADGNVDSYHIGTYALRQSGAYSLRLGAAYSSHDGDSEREVNFNGFNDSVRGDYDADSLQAFAELGYAINSGKLQAEPYANLGYQRYERDSYNEKGGPAALHVESQDQDNMTSTLGLRIARFDTLDNGMSFTPRLGVGWRHVYGDVDSNTRQSFLSGGTAFSVEGSALDRNSMLVEAGFDVGISARQNLGLAYTGQLGNDSRNHALMVQWQLGF